MTETQAKQLKILIDLRIALITPYDKLPYDLEEVLIQIQDYILNTNTKRDR